MRQDKRKFDIDELFGDLEINGAPEVIFDYPKFVTTYVKQYEVSSEDMERLLDNIARGKPLSEKEGTLRNLEVVLTLYNRSKE